MPVPDASIVIFDAVNNIFTATTPLSVSQTGLTAAVPLTTLYTPNTDGCALVSIYAIVTRKATGTSRLGPFTLVYTDRDTGTVLSIPVLLAASTGAFTNAGNTGNAIGTYLSGSFIANAKGEYLCSSRWPIPLLAEQACSTPFA